MQPDTAKSLFPVTCRLKEFFTASAFEGCKITLFVVTRESRRNLLDLGIYHVLRVSCWFLYASKDWGSGGDRFPPPTLHSPMLCVCVCVCMSCAYIVFCTLPFHNLHFLPSFAMCECIQGTGSCLWWVTSPSIIFFFHYNSLLLFVRIIQGSVLYLGL